MSYSYNPQQGQQWGHQQPGYPPAGYQPNNQQYAPPQGPSPLAMNGSQPYAFSQPAQPPQQQAVVDEKSDPAYGARFKPKTQIRDPIFLVLFLACFLGFIGLAGYALYEWGKVGGLGDGLGKSANTRPITLNSSTAYLLVVIAALGLVLSGLYILLVRIFTKIIIEVTLVLSIAVTIGIAIYQWITRYYSGAIIFTIIAVIQVLSYAAMRRRIPLATILLQIVIDIAKHHKSVYYVSFAGLIVQTAWSVFYAFAVSATYTTWTLNSPSCAETSCSSGKVAGIIFFLTFSYLWTSQVIGNIVLATLAGGPYGGWYYFGPYQADGSGMPKHPTTKAFVRASTTSLGSIAFGSLIVTLLELLKTFFRILQNQAAESGDTVGQILGCCAVCCVGCIESLVEWFNKYAYIQVALYGKPYIAAAKSTWHLFKDRGIDALVNDVLVGVALTYGSYAVGVLSALFAFLYLKITAPNYNQDGQYTAPILLFAFLIGLQACLTLTSGLDAGVSTIFVGLGEDPHVLAQRAPQLFEEIRKTYPHVVQGVPQV